jgi:hypothetical protein
VTPDAGGYWLVASDGGIFTFGDAKFFGSTGNVHLNQPIIGMAATPDGGGYWLYASDGGIFTFGNAKFFGSTGNVHLIQPIVGMSSTPDGKGYWLVAGDGGMFTFGTAAFHGSMGGTRLNQPVIALAPTPSGDGYWELAKDGGVFTFGKASFYGSLGAAPPASGVLRMVSARDGHGYWLVSHDGDVVPFGSAVTASMPTTGLIFDVETQGDVAVVWALGQLGKPYLWGGSGPDSFDCSGLVMRAWQAAGVQLPRTAAQQYGASPLIPLAALRPGDLVYYATNLADPSTIYHVSMFLGGTKVVSAPQTGEVVRVQNFAGSDLVPMGTRP